LKFVRETGGGPLPGAQLLKYPDFTQNSALRLKARNRLLNEAALRQKNREESKKDKLGHHA